MLHLKCVICGKEFDTNYGRRKTCCDPKCKKKHRVENAKQYYRKVKAGEIIPVREHQEKVWKVEFKKDNNLKWYWEAVNNVGAKLSNGKFFTEKTARRDFYEATGEIA